MEAVLGGKLAVLTAMEAVLGGKLAVLTAMEAVLGGKLAIRTAKELVRGGFRACDGGKPPAISSQDLLGIEEAQRALLLSQQDLASTRAAATDEQRADTNPERRGPDSPTCPDVGPSVGHARRRPRFEYLRQVTVWVTSRTRERSVIGSALEVFPAFGLALNRIPHLPFVWLVVTAACGQSSSSTEPAKPDAGTPRGSCRCERERRHGGLS
jgi:hypothetical protein